MRFMPRRPLLLGLGLAALAPALAPALPLLATPAHAQQQPAQRDPSWQPWFDPQQLPRFSGTVDRYLLAPDGRTDGFLFREGSQVLFPAELADELKGSAPDGKLIVVYGIRARSNAVITMLAWALTEEEEPRWVERPAWPRPPNWHNMRGPLRVDGTVRTPLYAANGELNGALLEDGSVIRMPPHAAAKVAERLKKGARVVAEGNGSEAGGVRSLLAQRIGETAANLAPIDLAPIEKPE